jgi:hypothetical protein
MCKKCGCNTCETEIRGPLLTEGKLNNLISENLQYHIDKNIPLMENIFRIGSDAHLSMIKEARKLYTRNVLDLCEEDQALMETHIGEFDLYENEIIPLDLPMLKESNMPSQEEVNKFFSDTQNETHYLNSKPVAGQEKTFNNMEVEPWDEYDLSNWKSLNRKAKLNEYSDENFDSLEDAIANSEFGMDYDQLGSGEKEWVRDEIDNMSMNEVLREKLKGIDGKACWKGYKLSGTKKKGGKTVDNCVPMEEAKKEIDEAEFKGKEVALNKPKRGGPKAYYVYVKDGDKVKKVTFGSGGLRAKIKNKEARNAFAARHKCSTKKDRTKAGYWSCNLPRYASQLGLGANQNTYW